MAEFSLAGALSSVRPLGTWWAAVPRERWPNDHGARTSTQKHWAAPFGDRRQELVFIGTGLDEAAIRARLDGCLLGPEAGDDPARWTGLPDPFPAWRRAEEPA